MDLGPLDSQKENYSGQLLLAHPSLKDPNFNKTVVLISVHSEDGTLGIILNRPTGKLLSEIDKSHQDGVCSHIPVFYGGPVGQDQIIVVAWQFIDNDGMQGFKLYFGITIDKAEELMIANPEICVQCYLGHSGWGEGQLDNEMEEGAWVIAPVQSGDWLDGDSEELLWKKLLGNVSGEMKLLVNAPDDPSVN
jgi:putative transcriptional regulator